MMKLSRELGTRTCMRRLCVLAMALASGISFVAGARANSFTAGDVFVSVGAGKVNEYTPGGTLVQTLDNLTNALYLTGSTFDSSGNFYVTNDSSATISQFASTGALTKSIWTSVCCSPESILFVATGPYAGTFFVGEQFQTGTILQYDASGTLLHTYTVGGTNIAGNGGANWIDFKDADTILYDGGGNNIRSFNITTSTQNADFAITAASNNALRVIPSGPFAGDVLVAQYTQAELYSSTGVPLKSYTLPGNAAGDFALTLDPNGTDFWTSDGNNGTVWEVNIATGAIDQQWVSTGLHPGLGLSVFGSTVSVCLLYDSTKPKNSGATIPIKIEVCDGSGNDLSSVAITVHAVSVTQISTSASFPVGNAGNSNPGDDFRFDSTLGSSGGYIFNLKTNGLPSGAYKLNFTVSGDSFVHSAPFEVK